MERSNGFVFGSCGLMAGNVTTKLVLPGFLLKFYFAHLEKSARTDVLPHDLGQVVFFFQ